MQEIFSWAMKKPWLFRVYRGLYYPSYVETIISHYKDTHQTTSISWKGSGCFFSWLKFSDVGLVPYPPLKLTVRTWKWMVGIWSFPFKKVTLGSRKMKRNGLWKKTSLLRTHLSLFWKEYCFWKGYIHHCPKVPLYKIASCEDLFLALKPFGGLAGK